MQAPTCKRLTVIRCPQQLYIYLPSPLQVGEGRLGVGDLRIEKTNEKAAKSVVFSVTVKGLYVKGNAACNLWSKRKQLKDAAAVVAVPIQRLVCSTY
jgi:hypothetical protein